ncbi:Protein N-acetyltransferase, RimJ/RimL family [Geosporobacter subterraneus DSM 17957]|uniref:Protein N-acetyltransferase, RimJ/RimL family n=1 Tax=Geosporobacter subterraneus DSM 17957 TaxID=1121919 RepID=A0A1M6PHH5_9FIRM|nr:GNAT family protein [Geosporobacter subterraneus]SHK07391.1 Protein N-acetyltransferase, RimJ/RimL family [Geosporobacter subterraneus DSM 17957]
MYFKKMVGRKCYLSPIDTEDYLKYTAWVNDMEVSIGMLFSSSQITADTEKSIMERLSKTNYNFAIVDLEKNELLGNVGFPSIDTVNGIAEVGIFIGNKDYWGKGYGTEAMQLILDFGFNILNLHSIYLKVFAYNKPAIECYKKAGFKEVGRLREAKQIAGRRYDEIYMDILAREFTSVYVGSLVNNRVKEKES